MFRTGLMVLLTSLAPLGCAPRALSVIAACTKVLGINPVTTILPSAGQIAKAVTRVVTPIGEES